jgi:hypothetical protein
VIDRTARHKAWETDFLASAKPPTQALFRIDDRVSDLGSLVSRNLVLAHAAVSSSVMLSRRKVTPRFFSAFAKFTLKRAFIR